MMLEDQHIESRVTDPTNATAFEYGMCEEDGPDGALHFLDVDDSVGGEAFHEGDHLRLQLAPASAFGIAAGTSSAAQGASPPLYRVQNASTELVVKVLHRLPAKKAAAHLRRRYGLKAYVAENELLSASKPAKMDLLILRLKYVDDSPSYCDEKCAVNALYVDGFERPGDPSVAKMIMNASYGKIQLVPMAQVKVLTVEMGASIASLSGCPFQQMAKDAEAKALAQFKVDASRFSFREYFIPRDTPGCSGWAGLANVGCGAPSTLPNPGACRAWYRYKDTYVRAHELGHNLGLSHAAGQDAAGVWREYGDPMAVMGAHGRLIDFTAPSRHAMGVLPETALVRDTRFDATPIPQPVTCTETCRYSKDALCDDGGAGSQYSVCVFGTDCADCGSRAAPPPSPPPLVAAGPIVLRSLDVPITDARGDAVAIVMPCRGCVPKIAAYADTPGGELWISFRDAAHELNFTNPLPNRVWVHFQRTYSGALGRGTESWGNLTQGQSLEIREAKVRVTVHVCHIAGVLATVTLGKTPSEAKSACVLPPPSLAPPAPQSAPFPPPTPPPPSPVPGANQPFTVTTDLRATGAVADYNSIRRQQLRTKFASQAMVHENAVGLTVTAVSSRSRRARSLATLSAELKHDEVVPNNRYFVRMESASSQHQVKLSFMVVTSDASTGEAVQAMLTEKLSSAPAAQSWLGVPVDLQPYIGLTVGETAAAKALGLKPDSRHPPPSPPKDGRGLSRSPAAARSSRLPGIAVAISVAASVWTASGSRF